MAYIGKEPADSFISFAKQDFSTSATTSYTLDNAVTNENELALFINFVRQEPTAAYTASGTTLTLTSATASTDDMYCLYLGQAKQTVNAPDGSVGNSQVASTIITGQTAETSAADADTIIIHDDSASALRKMTRSNFLSGVGGTNTPAFQGHLSSTQDVSDATWTKVAIASEDFDTDSKFDHSSNYRFTPTEAGKYFFYGAATFDSSSTDDILMVATALYKNGSRVMRTSHYPTGKAYEISDSFTYIDTADSDDYYEMYVYFDITSNTPQLKYDSTSGSSGYTFFGGYKILT